MFVLKTNYTYNWPVKAEIPKDGGGFEEYQFEVTFKQVSDSRIKEVFGPQKEGSKELSDKEFCKEVVKGWKDVKDEKGEEVPFSSTHFDSLMEIPGVSKQIVSSFLESVAGSKLKNL